MEGKYKIMKIYEELGNCTCLDDIRSLKKKLEGISNRESNENVELMSNKRKRQMEHLEKRLENLIGEVRGLYALGAFPEGLTSEAPEGVAVKLPTEEMVGTKFQSNMDAILACLMNNKDLILGVCGMGGAGKTTLVKHVYNEVLEMCHMFVNVYWVTVSKDFNIYKLQSKIAKRMNDDYLDADLLKEDDPLVRAGLLAEALERKNKFILFLDDVWNYLDLIKLGIPLTSGCKLVLTSRYFNVCHEMNCNAVIEVDPLTEKESWNLFVKCIGYVIPPQIEETAKDVARECAGLPLGISTLARSMKISDDIYEWNSVLSKLRKSKVGVAAMEEYVFKVLRLSYDRLDDYIAQQCLLYCAVYPEDFKIPRDELVWGFIDKELFDGTSMLDWINEAHSKLNMLERACLLSRVVDEYGMKYVKMHDLIRDMAIQIAGTKFMVNAAAELIGFPEEEDWTEDLEVASMMYNGIETPDIAPKCPRLSILLLQGSRISRGIPYSFFQHLNQLKVLNLSESPFEVLPRSISQLKSLAVLLLAGCNFLREMPSLVELTTLKRLDLSGTRIREVPEGLQMLIHLRYLNLNTFDLASFPMGVLPRLSSLQYLVFPLYNGLKVSGKELMSLRKLERFEGHLLDIHDFNEYVSHMEKKRGLREYKFLVGSDSKYSGFSEAGNKVILQGCSLSRRTCTWNHLKLPKYIQCLVIAKCDDIRSLCRIQTFNNAHRLNDCIIYKCKEMKYLSFTLSDPPLMSKLMSLSLDSLENFIGLYCGGRAASSLPGTFLELKRFILNNCPKIKQLFTEELLSRLPNLEELNVCECEELEEIIEPSQADVKQREEIGINTFSLPKLKSLEMRSLPKLKGIYSGTGLINCDSLKTIALDSCSDMKRILLSFPNEEQLEKLVRTVNGKYVPWEFIASFGGSLSKLNCLENGSGVINCASLQEIMIDNCLKLEIIPASLALLV